MDDRLQSILDALPQKPARSCLEPYGEFIGELRRRGRTYRDIADILAERFQLRVWASTVQRFVRVQSKARHPRQERRQFESGSQQKLIPVDDEVRQRIEALKRRPVAIEASPERFHYDPSEPLRLSREPGDNRS